MQPNSNDDNNDVTPKDKTKRAPQARTRAQNLWDQAYKSRYPHSKDKADSAPDSAPDSDPLAFPKAMMERAKSADPRCEAKASLAETGIAPDRDPVREQFAQIIALLDPKREFIDILSDNPTARSLLHAWFTKSNDSTDPNDKAKAKAMLAEAGIDPDSTTLKEFLEQYYKSRGPNSDPDKDTDSDSTKD